MTYPFGGQCEVCSLHTSECTCLDPWWLGFVYIGVGFAVLLAFLAVAA